MECALVDPVDRGDSVRLIGGRVPEDVRAGIEGSKEAMPASAGGDLLLPFGLSLPVGPLPRSGRLAGGRLSAARSVLFSSSSSEQRCSRALMGHQTGSEGGR